MCKNCINCVPNLSAIGKRQNEWLWPQNYECLMDVHDYPAAIECEWRMELNTGEATSLQE